VAGCDMVSPVDLAWSCHAKPDRAAAHRDQHSMR
jgi:hypothetical protein